MTSVLFCIRIALLAKYSVVGMGMLKSLRCYRETVKWLNWIWIWNVIKCMQLTCVNLLCALMKLFVILSYWNHLNHMMMSQLIAILLSFMKTISILERSWFLIILRVHNELLHSQKIKPEALSHLTLSQRKELLEVLDRYQKVGLCTRNTDCFYFSFETIKSLTSSWVVQTGSKSPDSWIVATWIYWA